MIVSTSSKVLTDDWYSRPINRRLRLTLVSLGQRVETLL